MFVTPRSNAMRLPIRSLIPMALGRLLASNGSSASPAQVDAASGLRASLGASLEELALGNSTGALVFLLNGIFALLFSGLAIALIHRSDSHEKQGFLSTAMSKLAR
jgi:hypothetical protein